MTSHAIERVLRGAWRAYVNEVAGWLPEAWRAAVSWTVLLPDLPAIDALLQGEAPTWTKQDPALALFTEADPAQRLASLQDSPFAPLLPLESESIPLGARWARHWRELWPKQKRGRYRCARRARARGANSHIERLARAGAQESSGRIAAISKRR